MIYVMSGSAKAFAVIGVTYPAGSVCTCTDGTKTLKLKDTSGQGFFLIPYAGTWTVMCYDGADYDSSDKKTVQSVEITSEGQSESVRLSYILELLKDGVVLSGYEFGFTAGKYTEGSGLYSSNDGSHGWCLKDTCKVDVTNYITMTIKTGNCPTNNNYGSFGLTQTYNSDYIGSDPTHSSWPDNAYGVYLTAKGAAVGIESQSIAPNKSYVFDISGLNGEWMPKFSGFLGSYWFTDIIFE